ncbi:MAG: hypothetical protein NC434_09625 [Ruminococcus sp.]|nr:hypothetical protein [Ruminococcus sp.]
MDNLKNTNTYYEGKIINMFDFLKNKNTHKKKDEVDNLSLKTEIDNLSLKIEDINQKIDSIFKEIDKKMRPFQVLCKLKNRYKICE